MRVVARRLTSTSPRMLAVALAALLALTAASLAMAQRQADAAPGQLTVSPIDTVGFPYLDLVLGGVAGLGLGPAPTVAVTQSGQPLRTTSTWDLSAANPLAVVVDSPAATLAKAQGLVAELVQEAPPALPLSLASAKGLAVGPGVNREALMAALAKQAAGTPTSVADGVQTATGAGIQHVLVVTTCASPAPAQAPVGVVVDVLGIGPACTGAWQTYVNGGLGTLTVAASFDTGLAALDATVARWRSSVVIVTQALSRDPLVLSVGGAQITAALPAAATIAPPAASPGPAVVEGGSGTDHTALVVGLVLFVLAGLLLVIRWRRRRPVGSQAFGAQDDLSAEIATYIATHVPTDEPIEEPIDQRVDQPSGRGAGGSRAVPVERLPVPQPRDEARLPAVIDLREERHEERREEPRDERHEVRQMTAGTEVRPVAEPAGRTIVELDSDTDGPDVRDEPKAATRMAVATRQANGHGETSQTAAVAELTSVEEPVVVAEQTPDEMQASEHMDGEDEVAVTTGDEAAPEQPADVEPAEVAADAPDEVTAEVTDEAVEPETAQAPEETTAEVTDDATAAAAMETTAEAAPAVAEPTPTSTSTPTPTPTSTLSRGEFQWTKLEFTPLVWRYDAEPETIDLREGAQDGTAGAEASTTVDVRDETVRKQPRRRKARR
jgi:hypothetical protein